MSVNDKKEELVKIRIDKLEGNDKDTQVLIGLNGKNYIIPRGVTCEVPKAVAEEYYRAKRAKEKLDANKDGMITQEPQN